MADIVTNKFDSIASLLPEEFHFLELEAHGLVMSNINTTYPTSTSTAFYR